MTSTAANVPLDFRIDQSSSTGRQDDDLSVTYLTDCKPAANVMSGGHIAHDNFFFLSLWAY